MWISTISHVQIAARLVLLYAISLSVCCGAAHGQPNPIDSADFEMFIGSQHIEMQNTLRSLVAECEGCAVLGPLDPLMPRHPEKVGYHEVRLVCDSLASAKRVVERLRATDSLDVRSVWWFLDQVADSGPYGFRGAIVLFDHRPAVSVTTVNQARYLIWARAHIAGLGDGSGNRSLREYARALSDHLYALDKGYTDSQPPSASEFDLPDDVDFYATPPDYVIQGYQNYRNYLYAHAEIRTDFATGILSFVPGDSLIGALKANAPRALFPNKEAPMLQHEYRKYLERGGDTRAMQTLTRDGFDTLEAGEYFFAVGASGVIRFGRELLRQDVERIERETGRKVPRANHAFLFPGEAILTAGAFWIERGAMPKILEVNAQSGHYFYSNVSTTIRDDIAHRSDFYLSTLGHFFKALDSLGIPYERVLISKM